MASILSARRSRRAEFSLRPFTLRAAAITLACTAALASSAAFSPAHAQSLQELFQAARGYDASYRAARAIAQSNEYRAEQSRALMRPNVALAAAAQRTRGDAPQGVLTQGSGTINTDTSRVVLEARQPLYNLANQITIEQSERVLDVMQADLLLAEQDLITRLAQAYFDVLAADDVLAAAKAGEKAIGEQLAAAKRAYDVGTATITDAREAQARADLATAQRLAAENDTRVKRLALDQFVGQRNVKAYRLASPVALPPLDPASMEAWVDESQARNPGVRRGEITVDVARLETQKARAGHMPTVDLFGSVGPTRTKVDGNASSGMNATVGVQVAVPLYGGGAVQNRVKETLLLEEKAIQDLEAAKRSLAQNARSAFLAVQSGQARVGALEAAEASSRVALQATQTGYRVGVRVNIDVLNAQTQLFQTQRDLALARYEVLLGILRLKQAAGSLAAGDLVAFDRLLTPVAQ